MTQVPDPKDDATKFEDHMERWGLTERHWRMWEEVEDAQDED